jgi:hypothetical protein
MHQQCRKVRPVLFICCKYEFLPLKLTEIVFYDNYHIDYQPTIY